MVAHSVKGLQRTLIVNSFSWAYQGRMGRAFPRRRTIMSMTLMQRIWMDVYWFSLNCKNVRRWFAFHCSSYVFFEIHWFSTIVMDMDGFWFIRYGCLHIWIPGFLNIWTTGCMDIWISVYMDICMYGCIRWRVGRLTWVCVWTSCAVRNIQETDSKQRKDLERWLIECNPASACFFSHELPPKSRSIHGGVCMRQLRCVLFASNRGYLVRVFSSCGTSRSLTHTLRRKCKHVPRFTHMYFVFLCTYLDVICSHGGLCMLPHWDPALWHLFKEPFCIGKSSRSKINGWSMLFPHDKSSPRSHSETIC